MELKRNSLVWLIILRANICFCLLSKSGLTIMFFEGFMLLARCLPKAQSNILQIAVYFWLSIAVCIGGLFNKPTDFHGNRCFMGN
jgi:hypothetical protein